MICIRVCNYIAIKQITNSELYRDRVINFGESKHNNVLNDFLKYNFYITTFKTHLPSASIIKFRKGL